MTPKLFNKHNDDKKGINLTISSGSNSLAKKKQAIFLLKKKIC
jgi:hypothetical protein